MDEASSMYPNLSDQTQFRLKKINEIKDHFISELSKYIATFDYFDKTLIFFLQEAAEHLLLHFLILFVHQ